MKPEVTCERVRPQLSARLDGEIDAAALRVIDAHLARCSACTRRRDELARVRRLMRVQAAPDVPDVTAEVVRRIRSEGPKARTRDEWRVRLRVGGIAAAAAALLMLGVSAPWRTATDVAAAHEIVESVRAAARTLDSYNATFEVTEYGWHPRVDVRRFSAELTFRAPEQFAMSVRDLTSYPTRGNWPQNDIDLIATPERWWLRAPTTCPVAALPGCPIGTGSEERTVVGRQPFDGSTAVPSDIILPLESLANARGIDVLGRASVAGRSAYRVVLPYHQAAPLLDALRQAGSWRPFHPLDRVDIWLDDRTWFPLRVEVTAGDALDRDGWETARGLNDARSSTLFTAVTRTFSEPTGDVELRPPPPSDITRDAGFMPRPFTAVAGPWLPSDVGGLDPYAAGVSADGRVVVSYAEGMTWLKVERQRGAMKALPQSATAEEVGLPGGYAYYEPADVVLRRRVDVYGRRVRIHIESNLPRADLLRVAASLPVTFERAPRILESLPNLTVTRLAPEEVSELSYATTPRYLPSGYRLRVATLTRGPAGETLTMFYRRAQFEYGGLGIRTTQSPGLRRLPPSSEQFQEVTVAGTRGRWSSERGELEWIAKDGYRAVAVPTFDLGDALRVAEAWS